MADTTTLNYGWVKPEVGASKDTWGNKVNTDLDDIDAQVFANADAASSGLALKANIASPTLTGIPAAPTAAPATNTTQIATTAFVGAAVAGIDVSGKADINSPTFTGDPKAPTPGTADNDTSIATTAYVKANLAAYAPLASPPLTGLPTAPTATQAINNTQIATTAFAKAAAAAVSPVGKQTIYFPAAALLPDDLEPPTLNSLMITNNQLLTWDFPDGVFTSVWAKWTMPKSWDGGNIDLTVQVSRGAATAFTAQMDYLGKIIKPGGDMTAALAGNQRPTVVLTDQDTLYEVVTLPIVLAGSPVPAGGDEYLLQISRRGGDGPDTLDAPLRLEGIKIVYTTNAPNDN